MVVCVGYTRDVWVYGWATEVLWNICITAQSYVSGQRLTYTEQHSTKVNTHNNETDAIPKMLVSYGWSVFHIQIGEHSSGPKTNEFCYIQKH